LKGRFRLGCTAELKKKAGFAQSFSAELKKSWLRKQLFSGLSHRFSTASFWFESSSFSISSSTVNAHPSHRCGETCPEISRAASNFGGSLAAAGI
jgi:hypothetical protein